MRKRIGGQEYPTSRLLREFDCPLCSRPVSIAVFLDACQAVVERRREFAEDELRDQEITDKKRKRAVLDPVYRKATVLKRVREGVRGLSSVRLSESWFEERRVALEKRHRAESWRLFNEAVNDVLLPEGHVERPLLPRDAWLRWVRDREDFSKNTLKAIAWAETNLKHLKRNFTYAEAASGRSSRLIKSKTLLPEVAEVRINRLKVVLRAIGKRDIRDVTDSDLRVYMDAHGETGAKHVEDLKGVFINFHEEGWIKSNPVEELYIPRKSQSKRVDFVPLADMQRILDQVPPENGDFIAQRDRMIVLLGYDVGARERELRGFLRSDIVFKNGKMWVRFRPDNQKGRKVECKIPIYHASVTAELRQYLKQLDVRMAQRSITGDHALFPTIQNGHFSQSMVSERVAKFFVNLGIQTYAGEGVTAHVLRHTMATLYYAHKQRFANSIEKLSQRLRHESVGITQGHYIHEGNPLIQDALAATHPTEQVGEAEQPSSLVFESGERFRDWAVSTLGLDPEEKYGIEELVELFDARRLEAITGGSAGTDNVGMAEKQAFTVLKRSGVETIDAMRIFFLSKEGARREGQEYVYSELKVRRFADEYVSAQSVWQQAQRRGHGFSKSTYKRRLQGLDSVKIGRVLFIRREDAAKLR